MSYGQNKINVFWRVKHWENIISQYNYLVVDKCKHILTILEKKNITLILILLTINYFMKTPVQYMCPLTISIYYIILYYTTHIYYHNLYISYTTIKFITHLYNQACAYLFGRPCFYNIISLLFSRRPLHIPSPFYTTNIYSTSTDLS